MSLGGSIIIPDSVNFKFLDEFKKMLQRCYKDTKFVVVCGGGAIARKYIQALAYEHKHERDFAAAGIRSTRMNAMFLMQFFGSEANRTLPLNMHEVKSELQKNKVVFCGALRYAKKETSDGTAAKLSSFLKTDFINMTDVKGLYTDNPKTNKNAKFISDITWKSFSDIANKIKFKAGQHFVLDQQAAILIKKHKIKTYIIGQDNKNLENLIKGKKFVGTTITG